MHKEVMIKKIRRVLVKYQQVELAYLFGSFALGNEHKDSDVDVAVKFSNKISQDKRFDLRLKLMGALAKALNREAEVVVLNDVRDLFFKYIILKEGLLIFRTKDIQQMLFETAVFSQYFDYAPFMEKYNQAYVQRSLQ